MLKTGDFVHTGSPAYFQLLKHLIDQNDFRKEIFLLKCRNTSSAVKGSSVLVPTVGKIKLFPYFNFLGRSKKWLKLEIVVNKLFQYLYIFWRVKRRSIYYLDRDNIALGTLLKFKSGLIVYRLLGVTRNIYEALQNPTPMAHRIFEKALSVPNSICIVTNDGSLAEKFCSSNKWNSFLLFNGVNKYTPQKVKKNQSDVKLLVYNSRITLNKGYDVLVEFLVKFRSEFGENFCLRVIGDGDERLAFEKLICQKNLQMHVQFLGEVEHDKVWSTLSEADLFLSFNKFGMFGNNVLEAASLHLPILLLETNHVSNEFKDHFLYFSENEIEKAVSQAKRLLTDDIFKTEQQARIKKFTATHLRSWEARLSAEFEIIKDRLNEI